MPVTISGDNGVSKVQDGVIVQADLATAILPLGVGQSYVNATGIRTFNADYTNDTGRPILVNVCAVTTNTSNGMGILVGGIKVGQAGISAVGNSMTISFIVPAGQIYRVNTSNFTLDTWAELR